jgi:uncharacterized repeat protein (TIGR03803 family)
MKKSPFLLACLAVALLAALVPSARSLSVETLYSWQVFPQGPMAGLIKGSDGAFYGSTSLANLSTTTFGGCVFRVTPDGVLKVIHVFPSGGGNPSTLVEGDDGNLYGTTRNGGFNGEGTIYRLSKDGAYTLLVELGRTSAAYPDDGMIKGPDGNFYGVTESGGTGSVGTLFRLTPGGTFTIVHQFSTATGETPSGRLVLAPDGMMYGCTRNGGTTDRGTVFRFSPSGVLTVISSFGSTGVGVPIAGLTLGPGGELFGITNSNLFKVTTTGAVTALHTFAAATGNAPRGELALNSDGLLYGATIRGGTSGNGVVFRINASGQYSKVAEFADTAGDFASVSEVSPGLLIGVTEGGVSNRGSVFRLTSDGVLTPLTDFILRESGNPSGPLIAGDNGTLFGTTTNKGNYGTIFRVETNGTVTTLAQSGYFAAAGIVENGLVKGTDNFLYGTSAAGNSSHNNGVVYRISQTGGAPTVVANMPGSIDSPLGPMVQAGDGSFYGTAAGFAGGGMLFKVTPAGATALIKEFFLEADGETPANTLTLANDGRLYGTTRNGGSSGMGTIFRIAPGQTPAFSKIVDFSNANGQLPTGVLQLASDGNLYGTTLSGSTNGGGTFFRLTNAGVYTVMARFGSAGAAAPRGAIAMALDGSFYGVTSAGGANGRGCVYRVAPTGTLTVLHSFTTTGPNTPMTGLTMGADAALYGTTTAGGDSGIGSAFRITTSGTITHFKHFDHLTGTSTVAAPLLAADQALYLLNESGGAGGGGTLLRIDTSTQTAPAVATGAANNVTASSASVHGTVTAGGLATSVFFERSDRPGEQQWIPVVPPTVPANAINTAFSASLSGLAPHTSYTIRAVARNSAGVSFGAPVTFQTLNSAPIAVNDAFHPVAKRFELDLTINDSDADADALVVISTSGAAHGSVTLIGPGKVAFDGNSSFEGNDSFSYTVSDGHGGSATGIVTLSNASPVAGSISQHSPIGPLGQMSMDVATFISDPDGDTLTVISASPGTHGNVRIEGSKLVYGPADETFTGNDSFSYTVSDGSGAGATGKVTLTNNSPIAANLQLHPSIGRGGSLVIDLAPLLSDSDGDAIAISGVSAGKHGATQIEILTLRYGPSEASFTGNDSFSYTVSDGRGGEGRGSVTLVNQFPRAIDDELVLDSSTSLLNVLTNDNDPEGDALTVSTVEGATWGSVTIEENRIRYVPSVDFEGIDEFNYTISDGRGATSTAKARIKANFPVMRVLAREGDAIPGIDGAIWSALGTPSLSNQGNSAGWLARFSDNGRNSTGIFSGQLGTPILRLELGSTVPRQTHVGLAQAVLRKLKQPVFAGEDFAFIGEMEGRGVSEKWNTAVWVSQGGELRSVAESGATAPGTRGLRFTRFDSVAMPAPNTVFFMARFQPYLGLDTVGAEYGLWNWTLDQTTLVLRKGETRIVGDKTLTVKSIRALTPVKGSSGHGRYDAVSGHLDLLIGFTDGSSAIATAQAAGALEFTRLSTDSELMGGEVERLGMPSSPGAGKSPVAIVTFKAAGAARTNAIFDFGSNSVVAATGMGTPEIENGVFSKFCDPVAGIGADGEPLFAFIASHRVNQSKPSTAVWCYDRNAAIPLRAIARQAEVVPDVAGYEFHSFESICLVDGRGPAFVCRIASKGDTRGTRALCAFGSNRIVRTLLREGESLLGQTIRRIQVLAAVAGSSGQTRSWASGDQTPSIILRAELADGTRAIVTFALP